MLSYKTCWLNLKSVSLEINQRRVVSRTWASLKTLVPYAHLYTPDYANISVINPPNWWVIKWFSTSVYALSLPYGEALSEHSVKLLTHLTHCTGFIFPFCKLLLGLDLVERSNYKKEVVCYILHKILRSWTYNLMYMWATFSFNLCYCNMVSLFGTLQ